MIDRFSYDLGTIVEMKKPHPCTQKTKIFTIVRMGADIKIKCQGCGNIIMMSRQDFESRAKRIIKNNE